MKELKIKPSKLAKSHRRQKLKEEVEKLKPILDKVSMEEVVKSVKENRIHR
ncbi:MAG: hypothetical protein QXK98_07590 [Candidatus Bathyarchaeia archaeon]